MNTWNDITRPWAPEDEEKGATLPAPLRPSEEPAPADAVAPAAPKSTMNPEVVKFLRDKYLKASDESGVTAARERADRAQMIAGIGSGLGQMLTASAVARGAAKPFDNSPLQAMAHRAQQGVGEEEALRQSRMKEVVTEDQLDDRDPNSPRSAAMRDLFKRMSPKVAEGLGPSFDAVSASDFDKRMPAFAKAFGAAHASDWQVLTLQNPDGSVSYVNYNKLTGERKPIEGSKGWRPTITKDPMTGNIIQVVPGKPKGGAPTGGGGGGGSFTAGVGGGSGASAKGGVEMDGDAPAPDTAPGPRPDENPNQYKARLSAWQAGQAKLATEQAKDVNVAEAAEAGIAKRKALGDSMLALYDGAEKENGVGPFMGRVSGLQQGLGVSAGKNTDKLMTTGGLALADYVLQQSGKTVTDDERKRLEALMPGAGMDRASFVNRMNAALDYADKLANEKRQAAGMPPRGGAPTRTLTGKKYNPSLKKTKLIYSDGTEELVDGQQ